jgi:hypothetical protein
LFDVGCFCRLDNRHFSIGIIIFFTVAFVFPSALPPLSSSLAELLPVLVSLSLLSSSQTTTAATTNAAAAAAAAVGSRHQRLGSHHRHRRLDNRCCRRCHRHRLGLVLGLWLGW